MFKQAWKVWACGVLAALMLTGCKPERSADMPSASDLRTGQLLRFGGWDNKDLNWYVLDIQGRKVMLMLAEAELGKIPYNEKKEPVTWETCTLRQWLNGEFYAKAFTENEKKYILEVTVPADRNPYFSNVDSGKAAQDRVFLLSIPEYEKLLTSEEMRIFMKPGKIHKQGERDGVYWWLRSPGCESIKAAFVFNHGNALFTYGDWVTNGFIAVRPILWIELKS
ncbi:MAG: hypothetical protein J5855_04020 [Mailhella sp.]|nr:hypothetical protein [Mailhella sp.]